MEKILNNPGLVHLAENVFRNLDDETLKVCGKINYSSKQILVNPIFWLSKFSALSKKNQKDWMKVIQSVKNTDKENAIIVYLQWNLKKDGLMDLPCYSSSAVQDDFMKKIFSAAWSGHTEIVKILAPLTENPNALTVNPNSPNINGSTPIYWAACYGHTEIVKILAPLTDNPNASYNYGRTPIFGAAINGHTEIVKILSPLTSNPNAPDELFGLNTTPIHEAAKRGYLEIVKILAPLIDNPDALDSDGRTPAYLAALNGHTEIVKILAIP